MKTKTLAEIIREAAKTEKELILPVGERRSRNYPLCMTCGRECDAANLENVTKYGCDIRAWHHGEEDSVHVSWKVPATSNSGNILDDKNVDWSIRRAMADTHFFDRRHIEK